MDTILVIDENRLDLDMAETVLANYGYAVIRAADGLSGLRLAFEGAPDLILLAMSLPDLSSADFCRRLRQDDLAVDIPVVFLVSPDDIDQVVQGLESGGDGYITKPYTPRELVAQVKSSLRLKTLNDALKERNRELAEKAITDGTTGLLNKTHTDVRGTEELGRSLRHGLPLSLLLLDVDFFKHINDTYGHLRGDTVLRELAKVLRLSTRSADIVGRYGGEEFLIILPQTEGAGARTLANRLRLAVESHRFAVEELPPPSVTVSIGGYTLPATPTADQGQGDAPARPQITWPDLVKQADEALYEAKRAGRNKVVVR